MSVVARPYGGVDTRKLEVGDELVVVERGAWGPSAVRPPSKVVRVGKRDITLDNKRRFSLLSGTEQGQQVHRGRLYDPADPSLEKMRVEYARATAWNRVYAAAEAFRRTGKTTFTKADLAALREEIDKAEEVAL